MKNLLLTAPLITSFAFAAYAFAHDAKFHKGPMIEGELTSLQNDHATVKTEKESVPIIISSGTRFEMGVEGKAASKNDFKVGQTVLVNGHKLETGEMVATEI